MITLEEVKNLTLLYIIMYMNRTTQRFSYDLEMKTREQKRNNKRTEIQQFDWFIERIQTHLAFGWLSELSRNRFDVILQQDWPIEQCNIGVFFSLQALTTFSSAL